MEWTEDDEKNLMDLGISEIERNKRLESLIARRRARKLLSIQARKMLMNIGGNVNDPRGHVASIVIPKNNPFHPNSPSGQFSPVPGSAPSVLLPVHNPFDLPYDPHEEKPNLTGDSFHEEFLAAHQKEMTFCRHESFSLGAFPGELKQDRHETSLYHHRFNHQRYLDGYHRSKPGSTQDREAEYKVIEQESYKGPVDDKFKEDFPPSEQRLNLKKTDCEEEDNNGDIQEKSVVVEDFDAKSSSSTSSEEDDESFTRIDKDAILRSLASQPPRIINADKEHSPVNDQNPLTFKRTRIDGHLTDSNMHHTPSHSIASDLQVEVSEVSSPPLTVDENMSIPDEEYSSYDIDMEKVMASGSEDTWATLSDQVDEDRNEPIPRSSYDVDTEKIREVCQVNQTVNDEVGLSRIGKSEHPVVSDPVGKRFIEQDSSASYSSSSIITEGNQGCSVSSQLDIDVKQQSPNASDLSQPLSLDALVVPVAESECGSAQTLMASPQHIDVSSNLDNQIKGSSLNGIEPLKSIEHEDDTDLAGQTEVADSVSAEFLINQTEEPNQYHTTLEYHEGELDVPTTSENPDGRMEDSPIHVVSENNDIQTAQDSAERQNSTEVQTTVLQVPMVEQLPPDLGSCSSPDSVLKPSFSVNLGSSSFDQEMILEAHPSNLSECDSSVQAPPGNGLPLMEESTYLQNEVKGSSLNGNEPHKSIEHESTNPVSAEIVINQTEEPNQSCTRLEHHEGKTNDPIISENYDGMLGDPSEHVLGNNDMQTTQDSSNRQRSTEVASTLLPEPMVEQTSSSPDSVLKPSFSVDLRSSSFDQGMILEAHPSNLSASDSSFQAPPGNGLTLMEDSTYLENEIKDSSLNENESNRLIQHEDGTNLAVQSEVANSMSAEFVINQTEERNQYTRLEYHGGETSDPIVSGNSDGKLEDTTEHVVPENNNMQTTRDSTDRQHTTEVASTVLPEPMTEQAPPDLGLSSSPDSVLKPSFSVDLGSSSFEQEMILEAHHSSNLSANDSSVQAFQNGLPLMEHSTAQMFHLGDDENLQESSEHQGLSEDANNQERIDSKDILNSEIIENTELNNPDDLLESSKATSFKLLEGTSDDLPKLAAAKDTASPLIRDEDNSVKNQKLEESGETIEHRSATGLSADNRENLIANSLVGNESAVGIISNDSRSDPLKLVEEKDGLNDPIAYTDGEGSPGGFMGKEAGLSDTNETVVNETGGEVTGDGPVNLQGSPGLQDAETFGERHQDSDLVDSGSTEAPDGTLNKLDEADETIHSSQVLQKEEVPDQIRKPGDEKEIIDNGVSEDWNLVDSGSTKAPDGTSVKLDEADGTIHSSQVLLKDEVSD